MKKVLSWPVGGRRSFHLARKLWGVGGLGLVFLAFAGNLWGFVGISPPIVEIYIRPGQSVEGKLVISNNQEETIMVNLELKDWWTQTTGISSPGFDQWLKISKVKDMKIGPRKQKSIKYKVKAPSDARGELMAMVFFSFHSKRDPAGNPTKFNIEMRHGAPIYVIIEGTEEVRTETKHVASYFTHNSSTSPIEFSLNLKNTGNVHVRPYGSISIYKEDALLDSFDLQFGTPIFPGQEERYFAKSNVSNLEEGTYQAAFRVTAGVKGSIFENRILLDKTISFRVTNQDKKEILIP